MSGAPGQPASQLSMSRPAIWPVEGRQGQGEGPARLLSRTIVCKFRLFSIVLWPQRACTHQTAVGLSLFV